MFLAGLAAGVFVFVKIGEAPIKLIEKAKEAVQPKITINSLVHTSMGAVKAHGKLVVLTAKVDAFMEKESAKSIGDWLPAGTTKVVFYAPENRIQFILPLEEMSEADFQYDEANKRLMVLVPHPKIDRDLIELDRDPKIITEVGWLRSDSRSGEHLRQEAKQDLRLQVLAEGQSDVYQAAARESARKEVLKLLKPAINQLASDVQVEVEFKLSLLKPL